MIHMRSHSRPFIHRPAAALWASVAVALALGGCGQAGRGGAPVNLDAPVPTSVPVVENPPPHGFDLDNGARIYMTKCVACHGPLGLGDGPQSATIRNQGKLVANLSVKAQAARPDEWYRLVGKGNLENLMPGFAGSLDAQARWDVTQYALAIGSKRLDSGEAMLAFKVASPDSSPGAVARQPVILHAYIGTGEAFTRTVLTDGQGVAEFRGLAARDFVFYQAETNYRGARFFSEPQQITRTAQTGIVNLPIFEVTTDPSVISLAGYQFVVEDLGEGSLSVVEAYAFQNSSSRAYMDARSTADAPRSVAVAYPAGAQKLRFDGAGIGERFLREGDLLRDLDAVLPLGRSQIILFYELPYHGSALIERRMTAPLQRYEVILPDSDLRPVGLQDLGAETIPGLGTPMRRFAPAAPSSAVKAGDMVSVRLTGQPRANAPAGADPRAIGAGFILFAIAIAAAYGLVMRARWLKPGPPPSRAALISALAALDDQFESGPMMAAEHRKRRSVLKETLAGIWNGDS